VAVDGYLCPDHTTALACLTAATTRRLSPPGGQGTTVQLRRRAPAALWKGCYREICSRPRTFVWTAAVSEAFNEVVRETAFTRRGGAVYKALEAQFGLVVNGDGVCVCPSEKDVSCRMMIDWRKSTKEARDRAQDSACTKACWIDTRPFQKANQKMTLSPMTTRRARIGRNRRHVHSRSRPGALINTNSERAPPSPEGTRQTRTSSGEGQ
jgi:hypothetical protein